MKTHSVILAAVVLLVGGSIASAQQKQYDSLGSPTPAPNQSVSPQATTPNVSGGTNADANDETGAGANGAKSETTGSGAVNGGVNGPVNSGTTTPTDSNTGVATPGGLIND
jgi:hypothetical protein